MPEKMVAPLVAYVIVTSKVVTLLVTTNVPELPQAPLLTAVKVTPGPAAIADVNAFVAATPASASTLTK